MILKSSYPLAENVILGTTWAKNCYNTQSGWICSDYIAWKNTNAMIYSKDEYKYSLAGNFSAGIHLTISNLDPALSKSLDTCTTLNNTA